MISTLLPLVINIMTNSNTVIAKSCYLFTIYLWLSISITSTMKCRHNKLQLHKFTNCNIRVMMYVLVNTHACTHACMHVCTHTNTHTHTHTHTYTCTHRGTYMQSWFSWWLFVTFISFARRNWTARVLKQLHWTPRLLTQLSKEKGLQPLVLVSISRDIIDLFDSESMSMWIFPPVIQCIWVCWVLVAAKVFSEQCVYIYKLKRMLCGILEPMTLNN